MSERDGDRATLEAGHRVTLEAGQWFHKLPRPFADALLAAARLRRLAPGERLFSRGDPPCGLYAVLEGALRVGAVSEAGKEALLAMVEPPSWFGEISLFDEQARTHDAIAEGPALLVHVPHAAVLTLLDREPRYWRDVALLMAQKVRLTFVALEAMSLLPARPRLARRLLMIAAGYGEASDARRVIQLAQEQLALMLALSRQTTNQILKELEGQGVLALQYGEITILDPVRLQQIAEG